MEPSYKPILRQVDVFPGEYQGRPILYLRDPLGFVDELIGLPQDLAFILPLMDGERDLRDLQVEASKIVGQIVPFEEIAKLVEFLDEKGLLWSESFESIKERAYEEWFSLKVRPMAHANQAYPLSGNEAEWFLEEVLKLSQVNSGEPPRVLIAPHIDIRVGAKAYAEAYQRFRIPSGSRVIVLGVGHYLDFPYSILTKDIATPFGPLRNDRGGMLFLGNTKKLELFPDHMAHKFEHSIEFQALFLKYLLGEEVVVLPILIGSYHVISHNRELVYGLVDGLLELMDDRTYLLLGVDMCHRGLRYGDSFPADKLLAKSALERDKLMLELAFKGETKELERLVTDGEQWKNCGSSSLFILSLIIERGAFRGTGEIFFQEAIPFGEGSFVSVASAGYFS